MRLSRICFSNYINQFTNYRLDIRSQLKRFLVNYLVIVGICTVASSEFLTDLNRNSSHRNSDCIDAAAHIKLSFKTLYLLITGRKEEMNILKSVNANHVIS